jgi:PKD repeat protein
MMYAPTGSRYSLTDSETDTAIFSTDTVGEYVITASAANYFGWSNPDTVVVTVVQNQPPTAIASATPLSGPAPLLVTFDGTLSSDPEGSALYFDWDFDDATFGSGEEAPHTYKFPGVYTVVLTTIDERGSVDFDIVKITVTPGGNVQVSPEAYDFGDVELGSSSSTLITLLNPLGGSHEDPLVLSDISLAQGSSADFAVTGSYEGYTLQPGESVDVEIVFSPTAEGYAAATLQITSDDPVFPLIALPLGGVGVNNEPPPEEQIAVVLAFVEAAVETGSLTGEGPGASAGNRLNALENMIEECGDLIAAGAYDEACAQLKAALKKCDGQPSPPDFVTGDAAPVLKTLIEELRAALGCE